MSASSNQFSLPCEASNKRFPAVRIACATKLLPVLLLLMMPAVVQTQCFTYTTNDAAITITGQYTCAGALTIPNTINGHPVTSIGDGAFSYCALTSVTIGTNVTTIGVAAFEGCPLTSATIGSAVTSIGENAFYQSTSLASITIPNSVITIGASAFQYCSSLTNATIGSSVTSIGAYAFVNC